MKQVDIHKAKDTGLALVLVLIILSYMQTKGLTILWAAFLLVLTMLVPAVFKPLAVVWFGLADLLSQVFSRILLTVLYLGIIVPIALVRKAMGADAMQLKKFRQANSGFIIREHTFTSKDLETPF